MCTISQTVEAQVRSRFTQAGYVDIGRLRQYPQVRDICRQNGCGNYGTSWACPPAVGTLEQCRERVTRYGRMLLFSRRYTLEDPFDLEGMSAGMKDFKERVARLGAALEGVPGEYLLLSNEGCGRCRECTYPHAPCRFPQQMHHALEGYGFNVSELAREAGMTYYHGPNTVTFFGALLFGTPGP